MASVFSGESVVVTKVLLVFHKISPFHINLIFIHIINEEENMITNPKKKCTELKFQET